MNASAMPDNSTFAITLVGTSAVTPTTPSERQYQMTVKLGFRYDS